VAQGAVVVGGLQVQGQAQSVKQGVTTSGLIPGGALVEREVPNTLDDLTVIRLALRAPDFSTAHRIEEAINARFGAGSAIAEDLGTVDMRVPSEYLHHITALVADLDRIPVRSSVPARIVIDERSGTIVVGADVKLDTVAVTHGNLTVRITETPQVSQPGPFSNGTTRVVPRTNIQIDDKSSRRLTMINRTANLRDLVAGLNALGLGPRDLIQVLNALKAAGALHAELQFI
jgi:flagellar P-ring protein FlgI